VQVDAIEQRPTDFAEVALDDPAGATAFVRRIAEITTRTPVRITTALEYKARVPAGKTIEANPVQEPRSEGLVKLHGGPRPGPLG
jgi:hypothetical protein